MKTIIVTGASGFIGSYLCTELTQAGYRVVGVSRTAPRVDVLHEQLSLGESMSSILQKYKPQAIIHGANSTAGTQFAENTQGTLQWMHEAQSLGVTHQVFLGSVSGNEQNTGEYGRAKHMLEQEFVRAGHTVLKMGLVLGPGGFFLKLVGMIKNERFLPLLDGGNDALYWTDLKWVSKAIASVLESPQAARGRIIHLLSSHPTSLKALFGQLRSQFKTKTVFFTLPSAFLYYPARFLERCNLHILPFQSTSIRSSRENAKIIWPSDLQEVSIQDQPIQKVLETFHS